MSSGKNELSKPPRMVFIALYLNVCANFGVALLSVLIDPEYYFKISIPKSIFIAMGLLGLIYFTFIYKIYKGKNWARIILSSFIIVGYIVMISGKGSSLSLRISLLETRLLLGVITILGDIMLISSVFMLFFPSSNRWFEKLPKLEQIEKNEVEKKSIYSNIKILLTIIIAIVLSLMNVIFEISTNAESYSNYDLGFAISCLLGVLLAPLFISSLFCIPMKYRKWQRLIKGYNWVSLFIVLSKLMEISNVVNNSTNP